MKLFSIPLDILKVMEASSKPKFGCKNANDFFIMSFRKCLINEKPISVTLHYENSCFMLILLNLIIQ